jgi:hypothetical protein
MKRLILAVIYGLAMAGTVSAAPWATCDCTPAGDNVTSFNIIIGTSSPVSSPAVSTCGTVTPVTCTGAQKTVCYDLASLPNGPFSIVAQAVNQWGVSPNSNPLSGTKGLPSSPIIPRIIQ